MPLRGPSFILPNIVTKPYVTITTPATAAGFVPAGSEPAYLKTEEPIDSARISTLDPLYTRWKVDASGVPFQLEGIGLPNINLSPDGLVRIVAQTDNANSVNTLTLAPNSIEFANNASGVATSVDEAISSPDGNYITPTTTTSPWVVVLGFPTPAAVPKTGAGMGVFVVRVNRFGTPANTQGTPAVTAILWEAGAAVPGGEFLGRRPITAEAPGQILVFHFDPDLLATASGADLELRLEFMPGDSGSYARLDAASFYYESAAVTYPHDSGYISSPFETFADQDDPPPTKSFGYWPLVDLQDAESFEVIVYDDQTHHLNNIELVGATADGILINALREVPAGYVDLGMIVAGNVLTFGNRSEGGDVPGIVGPQTPGGNVHVEQFGGIAVGGRTYGADAFRRIELQVELTITRDDLITLQDRIAWRRGKTGGFYFASEPDIDASRQLFTSGWFTLRDLTQPSRLPGTAYDDGDGTMLYVVTLVLEQKL